MPNNNRYVTLYIILLLFGVMCLLFGCAKTEVFDTTGGYKMPEGMEDCKVYYLRSEREQDVTVVRCPNSQTASVYQVPQGKTRKTINNVVIDGIEYEARKKE